MEIIKLKVDELIPYENNPRKNDKAVEYVANSIREFGFKVPIVIDKDYVVVSGHTRLKASKLLGLEEVPCIIADDLNEEQIKAFRLADNKVGEIAEWNTELLKEELNELFRDFDMNRFGFPVQIEDIEIDDLEPEEEISAELGEANNYVVLEFFTEDEWDKAQKVLGLKKVCTNRANKKVRQKGIGRVIKGKEWIEKLEGIKDEN
jgi:hypothetical protein